MNQRIFKRGDKLYIDCRQNGARERVATGLKATSQNERFVKRHFALFLTDKGAALAKWREFVDSAWDKEQISARDKAREKLAKKGDERFFVESVFARFEAEKSFLKERTKDNYKGDKKAISEFLASVGVFDVREISREHCVGFAEFLREKGLLKSSILNRMKTLNAFLKFALECALIAKNPYFLPKITALKESQNEQPFSLDEVQRLIKGASGELKSYLIIAFFTGARTGELFGLKFSDIDFDKNEIHIKRIRQLNSGRVDESLKTGAGRVIDMLPLVASELAQMSANADKNDFVFSQKSSVLHKDFKALCERVGVKAQRLYNTRHSFASIMLSRGEEPMWVGVRMLGHSTLSTTYKYYAKYLPRSVASRACFVNELDLGKDEPNLFENLA